MIGGEAGIGKSRLADELASRARDRGARVLWGRCWEAGGAPAYWPWVQAIRSYVRDQDPPTLQSQLGSGAADVAQLIPELHDLSPGSPGQVSSSPEGARFRLFDSTTAFLRNAARTQPLVLVLDDVHAADAPSLLLLGFVAGELDEAHMLVIGAYRDEAPEHDPLASTLAEVGRLPVTRHIRLAGLNHSEVARFIESTGEVPAPATLIAAVHTKTEGNPLFVEEVIRLLAAEGHLETGEAIPEPIVIPPRIREAIGRRLALLSERCRVVLTFASVLGWEFRLDALERLSGLSGDTLLDLIDEAATARVVIEVPAAVGRMRFSHALVRDVLYDSLAPGRRVRLHREVGETLEGLYAEDPEPHLAELAHHFCEAAPGGDTDKAVEYARRAGERALALLAYEEGVRFFRLALLVLETKAPADDEAGCRLLLALGESQAREGDLEGAMETFLRAANLARRRAMPEHLAGAALGYGGRFVWARAGSDRQLVPLLEEALRSIPEGDSLVRARLMARLAGALRDQRSPDQQDRLSAEAVEMARRTGDPATLAYTLEGRFAATWWPDNAEERLAIATEILQLARQADDRERIAQGLDWQMVALMELGDIGAVDADLEAAAVLVEELRQPAQRWLQLHSRAMRALFDGRFDEAERLIPEALSFGERAQRWDAVFGFRIQMYFLRKEQGRLEEMEAIMKRSVAEFPTRYVFRAILAHLHSELGRTAEAHRAFEGLAVEGFADLRRDNDWLFEMSLLAEVVDFLGDVDRARILYELLSPYGPSHVPTGGEAGTGSVSRCLGILASMLRRWDVAVDHFEEALERNAAMGARPWVAHTQFQYARMLVIRDAQGDRERAAELLAGAAETCDELSMPSLAGRVATLLEGEDISSAPPRVQAPSLEPTRRANVFRREGEYWSIGFERDAFRLKDSKGLRYLAELLRSPGREFLALDLATAGRASGPKRVPVAAHRSREPGIGSSSSEGAEILDPQAKRAYRRRLEELRGELEEAEGWADPERAARAREEMDFLARELSAAIGLGGKDRRAPSDAERARVNVTKALRAALTRIDEHSPSLGRHLVSTIRTGTFCSYVPDPQIATTWHF